jgi:hypothetical protein
VQEAVDAARAALADLKAARVWALSPYDVSDGW